MKNTTQKDYPERDSCTLSPWQDRTEKRQGLNAVANETEDIYDVLIVGGGITGITTALLLQQAGKRCILAEGHNLGYGTTGGTTAHLNTFFDASYSQIERDFGEAAARQVAEAGKDAFSMITGLIEKYQIDCDFEYKDAWLFSENKKESKELLEILESSRKAGIQVVEDRDNGVPLPFELSKDQGQFHPLKYIYKLAEEFVKAGGILLEDAFVEQVTFEKKLHETTINGRKIKAGNLVYATHIPPGINLLHFTCAPYRSYVLGLKLKNDNYPAGLIYDMKEPYHYFRTHVINRQPYLILGGEDHKTGHDDPEQAFASLEAYAREYYNVASVDYKWSAQYYIPADGLPYIGPLPGGEDHTFVASGYNGNGIIFGTLAGKIISDQILGKAHPYGDLFNPSRIKPVAGFSEFVKENADVAYHFIADRLTADEISSLAELAPEQGKIVEYQDKKLAIYKDATGNIKALDPVCTHAGCFVNFNASEKSWDCPCHGGRFSLEGQVLTGPPVTDLKKVNIS